MALSTFVATRHFGSYRSNSGRAVDIESTLMTRSRSAAIRHSITSSARDSIDEGTSIPMAFADFKLMTSSNFVGCWTASSPGLAPLRLLNAARQHLHLRRAILLQLYTGSRPGVILALRWDQIDLAAGVLHRLLRGATQDDKKRAPPVRLGRRIHAHLRRWKRLDGPSIKHVCHYNGQPTRDPHDTWRKAVKAAGLTGITRHTLRHTRATWMMQRGVPIWEAAGFLGMTIKTLEAIYGHHSPDHQGRAANI